MGIEALVPVRHVISRVRFHDADRLPLERPQGDIHHRDETLFGIADPWLTVNARSARWGPGRSRGARA